MINSAELIQDYKDQGFSSVEAVQLAKEELAEKRIYSRKSNRAQLKKLLESGSNYISEDTNRSTFKQRKPVL